MLFLSSLLREIGKSLSYWSWNGCYLYNIKINAIKDHIRKVDVFIFRKVSRILKRYGQKESYWMKMGSIYRRNGKAIHYHKSISRFLSQAKDELSCQASARNRIGRWTIVRIYEIGVIYDAFQKCREQRQVAPIGMSVSMTARITGFLWKVTYIDQNVNSLMDWWW